jgi:iron(III) transport system ATP-binding protein
MMSPEQQAKESQKNLHYPDSSTLQKQASVSTAPREITSPYLQVENVHKTFGNFMALRDIYLDVYPGEFVCLLGPSGCGKTTLLRIIAGLEQQTQGRVIQADKDVSNLPPSMRDFGIVFQSYALFPNLTAAQNIAYGLRNTKQAKTVVARRVEELLDTVGLTGFSKKYPSQLSGGQQQRVALARALALSPGLLLLDEPLSALDAKVRVKLRAEITQLQKRLGITTIMVTHDQAEALAMADRVVVMDKGYIAQVGTPSAIYQHPNTPFVANFIGVMNFLKGVAVSNHEVRCGNLVLTTQATDLTPNSHVVVAIRPEDICVIAPEQAEHQALPNVFSAEIQELEFLGASLRISLTPDGNAKEPVVVEMSSNEARGFSLRSSEPLTVQFPPDLIRIFSESEV